MPAALLFWSKPLWKFLKDTHRVTTCAPGKFDVVAELWPPSLNPLPSPWVTRFVPLPHVQQLSMTFELPERAIPLSPALTISKPYTCHQLALKLMPRLLDDVV